MYKLIFYVPPAFAEKVKLAVFATGAGQIGEYDQCCFESSGTGQFRPSSKAQPFIGKSDELERVAEIKVELVCDDARIQDAIQALIRSHPYEQPAWHCWKVITDPGLLFPDP